MLNYPPILLRRDGGAPVTTPVVPAVTQVEREVTTTSVYTRQGTPVWEVSSNKLKTAVMHTLTDDGLGGFIGTRGTANYAGKELLIKFALGGTTPAYQADYEDSASFNAATMAQTGTGASVPVGSSDYSISQAKVQIVPGSKVVVKYRTGAPVPVDHVMTWAPPAVAIDLCPYTSERVVAGSVRFSWMGTIYEDYEGLIYRDRSPSSPGIVSGEMDYETGIALMTDYVVSGSPTNFTLLSLWTAKPTWRSASVVGMTDSAPLVPQTFELRATGINGDQVIATTDPNGGLQGDHVLGRVNENLGMFEAQFGDFVNDADLTSTEKSEWWYRAGDVGAVIPGKIWRPFVIDPDSIRVNYVSRTYLPVDPEILGLEPTRLPSDGRVPVYAKGRVLCVGYQDEIAPDTYSASDEIVFPKERITHVWVKNASGHLITSGYSATEAELDAGKITVTDPSEWEQPVSVIWRIQEFALCTDVQINGTLGIQRPLSYDFPAGSVVSSVLLYTDAFGRIGTVFDQKTWDGITFRDSVYGDPAVGTYNAGAYPIEVTNGSALPERYAIRFRSNATDFDLIGEFSGAIAQGTRLEDFEPMNPYFPGRPLFKLKAAGWGSLWAAGETLFIPMYAAMRSFAAIRAVQPSAPTGLSMHVDLLAGGDIDRPPSAP